MRGSCTIRYELKTLYEITYVKISGAVKIKTLESISDTDKKVGRSFY